jgi:hypothetical protein
MKQFQETSFINVSLKFITAYEEYLDMRKLVSSTH